MTKCSKCDKCGRIVENEKDITKVSVSYFEKDEALLTFKEVKEDFEFCKNCRDLVLDFLKMHKGGADNTLAPNETVVDRVFESIKVKKIGD